MQQLWTHLHSDHAADPEDQLGQEARLALPRSHEVIRANMLEEILYLLHEDDRSSLGR